MWNFIVGLYNRVKTSIVNFFNTNLVTIKKALVWTGLALSAGALYLAKLFSEVSITTITISAIKAQWFTVVAFISSFSVVAMWASIVSWWTILAASVSSITALSTAAAIAASSVVTAAYVVLAGALVTLFASVWSIAINTAGYVAMVISFQSIVLWIALILFIIVVYYSVLYLGESNDGLAIQ